MSIEAVEKELREKGADTQIFPLEESGATVEEAAQTIGVEADAIAKTLALHLKEDVIIVVMSGAAKLDNKKYRESFGAKARMLSYEEVEPLTGHPVGGLCPLGLKGSPKIFLDQSIHRHPFVYPAAGDRYHAFRIAPKELEELTGGQWVDVCK